MITDESPAELAALTVWAVLLAAVAIASGTLCARAARRWWT